jgi:hypothetical protein
MAYRNSGAALRKPILTHSARKVGGQGRNKSRTQRCWDKRGDEVYRSPLVQPAKYVLGMDTSYGEDERSRGRNERVARKGTERARDNIQYPTSPMSKNYRLQHIENCTSQIQ